MAICPRCGERERDGKRSYCKECQREYARERYEAHREEQIARNKKYRELYREDPEKHAAMLEYSRRYRQEHKDEIHSWAQGYKAYKKMRWDQQKRQVNAVADLLKYLGTVVGERDK